MSKTQLFFNGFSNALFVDFPDHFVDKLHCRRSIDSASISVGSVHAFLPGLRFRWSKRGDADDERGLGSDDSAGPYYRERWGMGLITGFVVQGTNTISFTHANFDCPYSDQVSSLVVSNQTSTVYSNATVENINTAASCTNTLSYSFTV